MTEGHPAIASATQAGGKVGRLCSISNLTRALLPETFWAGWKILEAENVG